MRKSRSVRRRTIYISVIFFFSFLFFSISTNAIAIQSAFSNNININLIKLLVTNPSAYKRVDEPIIIPLREIKEIAPDFTPDSFIVTTFDAKDSEEELKKIQARQLLSQIDDVDGDGNSDELVFLIDLEPFEKKVINICYGELGILKSYNLGTLNSSYPARVRAVNTDHGPLSKQVLRVNYPARTNAILSQKLEGPAWESDIIGYRLYLDDRNAIDVFGKINRGLELERYASFGYDYHRATEWGMDVLKVGQSLGLGGFGAWIDGKLIKPANNVQRKVIIRAKGPARALVEIRYSDWRIKNQIFNIVDRVSIFAGQRWAESEIEIITKRGNQKLPLLATGVGKQNLTEIFADFNAGYLATWGKQALGDNQTPHSSNLGLAIIIPPKLLMEFAEDTLNHLAIMKLDKNNRVRYRLLAIWENETNTPVKESSQFENYIKEEAKKLTEPVQIKFITSTPVIGGGLPPADTLGTKKKKTYSEAVDYIIARIKSTMEELGENFPTTGDNITGKWQMQTKPVPGWTGGFWVAMLWRAYQLTGEIKYRELAERLCPKFAGKQAEENHDAGFLNYYSFAFGYDITKEDKWKHEAIAGADRLIELYNPKTQLIAAWKVGGDDSIIDTMMNLQLLWWAYKQTNNKKYQEVAVAHALKTRQYFVRPDGSTYQSVHFDVETTGEPKFIHTHQGCDDQSVWSRGQSWALYGFVRAYQETKDERFLLTADHLAGYIISHLPEDYVPWYDYSDPGIMNRCKDTSAGAVAASAFLQFSELHPNPKQAELYKKIGIQMVNSLIDRYLTPVNPEENSPPGILRHGCNLFPNDLELIYGDYFLLESLTWLTSRKIARE